MRPNGSGSDGIGCVRRGPLTGNVTLRDSDLINGPDRLTCAAIKTNVSPCFWGSAQPRESLTFTEISRRTGGAGRVVIPDRMMHGLKMPDPLTSRGIKTYQALSVEVVAGSVAAVIVAGRRFDRKVNIAERWIRPSRPPISGVSRVIGRIVGPTLKNHSFGSGNGIKTPAKLTQFTS
ncbi:MAG: hypothetical protein CM15mP103_11220 [Gammaproteobacteria bacterium]|nr:MAG: hypothetical protein CM15mP103_11220 [Gammaproteobacteria bacterium]